MLVNARNPANAKHETRTIAQIAREAGRDPADVAWDLVAQGQGRVMAIYHMMSEGDIETALRFPWTSIGSDAGAVEQVGVPDATGLPHPRSFGNHVRVIARYVKDKKTIRLEEAVRKMTSLPAQILGLKDRGQIREGFAADLAIFDAARVRGIPLDGHLEAVIALYEPRRIFGTRVVERFGPYVALFELAFARFSEREARQEAVRTLEDVTQRVHGEYVKRLSELDQELAQVRGAAARGEGLAPGGESQQAPTAPGPHGVRGIQVRLPPHLRLARLLIHACKVDDFHLHGGWRIDDLDRFAALGIRTIRYPFSIGITSAQHCPATSVRRTECATTSPTRSCDDSSRRC